MKIAKEPTTGSAQHFVTAYIYIRTGQPEIVIDVQALRAASLCELSEKIDRALAAVRYYWVGDASMGLAVKIGVER